jgi:NCAIR mutase (PurE)-related protein
MLASEVVSYLGREVYTVAEFGVRLGAGLAHRYLGIIRLNKLAGIIGVIRQAGTLG